ncbi:HK97 family phage prohead protease [Roseomonas sp. GC11]|uniref:HK97 family phage prohead protease n=1 Tax=Roseomonas sp. GC11 TaxID=2950546 RepID=UPI00210CABBD|nr:HK97 family phage prohead protease [Roseomonas sp. GC11]MCQ4160984.1 HK97 family phage prohead protease [Roseomonas sp. GC11]
MSDSAEPGGETSAPDASVMPIVAQRAIAAPATVDRAARTVEVVWSTGARARNIIPALGLITEELEMSPQAVRMEALRSGQAPVLNTNRRGDARYVLGRVTAARLERGRGYATLQFSTAADVEPVWQRVADGTLQAVSVGYRVHRYTPVPDPATGETIHRAVDWEPFEISVVPVPIDPAAAVLGEGDQPTPSTAYEPPLPNEESPMPETIPLAAPAPPATPPQETPVPPNPPAAALEAVRAEAEHAALDRLAAYDTVLAGARGLLAEDLLDGLRQSAIRERIAPEVLRGRLWEAFTRGAPRPALPARPESGPTHDDPAVLIDTMAEALAARAMPGYQPQGNGRHAEFLGWRPSDMIGELLRLRGER